MDNEFKKRRVTVKAGTFFLLLIFFSAAFSFSIGFNADASEMRIDVDFDDEKLYEGDVFTVSVYDPSVDINKTGQSPYLSDVLIYFNMKEYLIPRVEGYVEIKAPEVTRDTNFLIIANKTGYEDAQKNITVVNKPLLFVSLPEGDTVDGSKNFFTVKVTEESLDGKPVANATVAIQNYGTSVYLTDKYGRAFLKVPKNREEITIKAIKPPGYKDGFLTAKVNLPLPWWETFISTPYFPIVVSVIVLTVAIIIVNTRSFSTERRKKMEKIDDEKEVETGPHGKILELKEKKKTSKVEEIRISRPKKEKEIVTIKKEKEEILPVISKNKENEDEWFKGAEERKYELNKLTGEIDEEKVDKWFEGVNDTKNKIEDKLKKRKKKTK